MKSQVGQPYAVITIHPEMRSSGVGLEPPLRDATHAHGAPDKPLPQLRAGVRPVMDYSQRRFENARPCRARPAASHHRL